MLNTGLAKIGFKEFIYKVMPPVFLVTLTNKRNTCKILYVLCFPVFKCVEQVTGK